MVVDAFELARLPSVSFGEGTLQRVPEIAASLGARMLLLTRAHFFSGTDRERFEAKE